MSASQGAPPSGGLFGGASNAATPQRTVPSGGLFGGSSTLAASHGAAPSTTATSGGLLFGAGPINAATASSSTTAPSRLPSARGVFGAVLNTSASPGSSLFGAAPSSSLAAPSSVPSYSGASVFGSNPPTSPGAIVPVPASRPILGASDASSWEPSTTSSYDEQDMVTLLVGTEERRLLAHGSHLALCSDFFKAALKKEWAEGQTRTVKLSDERPEIVAQYLDFVYSKGLPTGPEDRDPHKGRVYEVLTELFALGERLLDSNIRNAIINEIIKFTTAHTLEGVYYPGTRAINNIYDCTTAASPARRLMVELYVTAGKKDWFTDELHPAFLLDMSKELMSEVQSSTLACRSRKGTVKAEHYRIVFG